jgi:hypothetical protein
MVRCDHRLLVLQPPTSTHRSHVISNGTIPGDTKLLLSRDPGRGIRRLLLQCLRCCPASHSRPGIRISIPGSAAKNHEQGLDKAVYVYPAPYTTAPHNMGSSSHKSSGAVSVRPRPYQKRPKSVSRRTWLQGDMQTGRMQMSRRSWRHPQILGTIHM